MAQFLKAWYWGQAMTLSTFRWGIHLTYQWMFSFGKCVNPTCQGLAYVSKHKAEDARMWNRRSLQKRSHVSRFRLDKGEMNVLYAVEDVLHFTVSHWNASSRCYVVRIRWKPCAMTLRTLLWPWTSAGRCASNEDPLYNCKGNDRPSTSRSWRCLYCRWSRRQHNSRERKGSIVMSWEDSIPHRDTRVWKGLETFKLNFIKHSKQIGRGNSKPYMTR